MNFASDNTSGAHPAVMQALLAANEGHAPSYGADALSQRASDLVREVLDAPGAAVWLVPTGTAANSLALASLARPFDAIFCTGSAHINVDECNAPEFFTGGAKLITVTEEAGKMTPAALRRVMAGEETRGIHGARRGPVSVTTLGEWGTRYSAEETAALAAVARGYGSALHLDGARFANAVAAGAESAAALTWQAGADALSFGGTKNGCFGVEAVVIFDPEAGWEFERRRKRAGHLFSKHRFLAAQMAAWLEDGLWLDLARHANAMGQRLRRGLAQLPGVDLPYDMPGNLLFVTLPLGLHRAARAAGAQYHVWSGDEAGADDQPVTIRLVASWNTAEAEVEALLSALKAG